MTEAYAKATRNALAAGSASRIGVRIAPAVPFNDIQDADTKQTYTTLVKAVSANGLAYLHVLQAAMRHTFELLRPHYPGTFLTCGGFTNESGHAALKSGLADFIICGGPFIANPDLPNRVAQDGPLAAADPSIFYSPGAKGYTDWTTL